MDSNSDFVHVQYDDFVEIVPYIQYPCAITSHFGYLEQPNRWDYYGPRVAKKFADINQMCSACLKALRTPTRVLWDFLMIISLLLQTE